MENQRRYSVDIEHKSKPGSHVFYLNLTMNQLCDRSLARFNLDFMGLWVLVNVFLAGGGPFQPKFWASVLADEWECSKEELMNKFSHLEKADAIIKSEGGLFVITDYGRWVIDRINRDCHGAI